MNEQLQKELAAWLAKLRDAADAGGSFAMEQAPLIVQEKLAYGRVAETATLVVIAGLIALCVLTFWKGWRYESGTYSDDTGGLMCVISGVIGVIAVIPLIVQGHVVAQVWLAPRLYIIEWLAGLLK